MRESTIEKKVCDFATKNGWLAFKWCSPQIRGVPDRIFFKDGRAICIEFKATGKKPSELQKHLHNKLGAAGIDVYVVDSVADGRAVFERYAARLPASSR